MEVVKERTKALEIERKGMSQEVAKGGHKTKARGFSICAVFETSGGCVFSVEKLVEGKALDGAEACAEAYMEEVERTYMDKEHCIDEHHSDQLLVYMAMAKGTSRLKLKNPVSLHFKTMIALLRIIAGVVVIISPGEDEKQEEQQTAEGEGKIALLVENANTRLSEEEESVFARPEGTTTLVEIQGLAK